MRKTRMGKRICVHRVPVGTTWFCPYCCATADTAFLTLGATGSRTHTSARLTHLLDYSRAPLPFGGVSGHNHEETYAGCIVSLAAPNSSAFSASRPTSSRNVAEKQENEEPTSGLDPLICSSYEFAGRSSSPSLCVR
jgi:hypothetical protein